MHQYRFTLDGNVVQPISIDGFSRILDISDRRVRRVEYSGTLQFCDEAYDSIVNNILNPQVSKACATFEVTIEYRENPHDVWTNFGDARIDLNSVELDAKTRTVSISLDATSNIKKLMRMEILYLQ
jgi:hypothetical protein